MISIFYLYRRKEEFGFDFKRESFRISGEVLKPLLVLGIPMAIQSAAINISKIVLTAWINAEGVECLVDIQYDLKKSMGKAKGV